MQFIQHALDAFLELAAILGACDHAGQIERNQTLILEVFRYVAGDDLLCQAFGNRRLADARVTDQSRIVLGAAGQNLDDAIDLVLTADDRVQLTFASGLGQVLAVLFNGLSCIAVRAACRTLLCHGDIFFGAADRLQQGGVQLLHVDTQRVQYAQRDVLTFADKAEQQVLGAHIADTQLAGRHDGQFYDLLGARGQALRGVLVGCALAGHFFDLGFDLFGGHAKFSQRFPGDAAVFLGKAGQQMLGTNIAVAHLACGFLGQTQGVGRTFGESILIEHKVSTSFLKEEIFIRG